MLKFYVPFPERNYLTRDGEKYLMLLGEFIKNWKCE
jgi:hypothetical protein